ncbi:MAG: tetratricopeptide repeat protein [Candidatus Nitrohelix vancouverensis]|uniref:Tetratricopeptide repeat protein n=1 Tax=Candidatus Nitrohelix vancouverensis TaxID=2705534 RepID=A0A7T0C3G0_9BACT|nr:MAG: tetratricopeptide repeat protein [Candidatus Nitrohelix vancouverensis]
MTPDSFRNKGWIALGLALTMTATSGCETLRSFSLPEMPELKAPDLSFVSLPKLPKLPTSYSKKINSDLEFAQHQFQQGKFDVAEYYFKKTLLTTPHDAETLRQLPWAYFYQQKYDQALTAFQRATTFAPKSAEPWIGLGWAYFATKRYEEATDAFKRAEELTPEKYQVLKGKGFCYFFMNRPEDARQEWEQIYNPEQVQELWTLVAEWKSDEASPLPRILSLSPRSPSIFTLPVEAPRYQSALLGYVALDLQDLKDPWRLYGKQFFDHSVRAFEEAEAIDADGIDRLNGLGWSLLHSKRIREAEDVFKRIKARLPHFPGSVQGLQQVELAKMKRAQFAHYYFDKDKTQLALNEYEDLKEQFPDWAHPQIQIAYLKLKERQTHDAWKIFESALAMEPSNPDALQGRQKALLELKPKLHLADALMQEGNFKKASLIYADYIEENESVGVDAFLAKALNGLGWGQFKKRQYDLSAEKFIRASVSEDYKIDSARGAGMSFYRAGNYAQAEKYLKIAHDAQPDNLEIAYLYDDSVLKSWSSSRAMEYFNQTLKRYPLRASLYMGIGWLRYELDNRNLAIEYFGKAISLDPSLALNEEFEQLLKKERFGWQVYNQMGWAYYHKKQYDKSMEMFLVSMRQQPNKSEARMGLGYNLLALNKLEDASLYLRQTLALNPQPKTIVEAAGETQSIAPFELATTVRSKLGRLYLAQNRNLEALALLKKELEMNPDQPDALDALGWTLLKLNRLPEARAAFLRAVKVEPLNNSPHNGLNEVKQAMARQKIERAQLISALPR